MKTVFVGGGAGCKAVLEMALQQRLATLSLEIVGVMDIDPEAPGMRFARQHGWSAFARLRDALAVEGLELVIELTGKSSVVDRVYRRVPAHVRVMDHTMARVFWDLDAIAQNLRSELRLKTRLEAEIRQESLRRQELLDSLPDLVMVVDEGGTVQKVNRRFEEVSGMTADQVIGLRCNHYDPERERCSRGAAACPREAVLETGESLTVVRSNTCFFWNPDDREAFFEVTATPTYNSAGGVSVVMTSREVTELVRLKRSTEEEAQRFKQIIDAVHGMITIKGLDGRYQVVNPAAARFAGMEAEAFEGKTAGELFPPEVAAVIHANDDELMRSGNRTSREETIVHKGEEHILISERILLTGYRHQPVAICCISRDVTEPRRLHWELLQSEKHAAVGKLAAGVAHEINNPLTGILTFSEEIREDLDEGDPLREDMDVIIHETLRCRRIVRDLLDFSRQTATNRHVTQVETIITRSLDLVRRQASFHDITFDLDLANDMLNVRADPNQMQQVILNLVSNVRDAVGGVGKVHLRTRARSEAGRVVVEVEDHGKGIADHEIGRIFEPFYSTKGEKGNGLGLAAVRSIIDQHEGDIDVHSRVGEGTVFRVSLPAVRRATRAMPVIDDEAAGPSDGGESTP